MSYEIVSEFLLFFGVVLSVGLLFGLFFLFISMFLGLLNEFFVEIVGKEVKMDSDLYFWMLFMMKCDVYVKVMSLKGEVEMIFMVYYARM